MAEEQPQGMKIGDGLYIALADPSTLREQDINAQVMNPHLFDQLTENVKTRGQLESLPYCYQYQGEGTIEIISGHHRVRAAVAAGLESIPILLDTQEMKRSEKVAKQIAHNQLSGEQDTDTLRTMLTMIDDIDDMITTGLPDDLLPTPDSDDTALLVPSADFAWRTVTLMFLPEDLEDLEAAVDQIDKNTSMVGLADREIYEKFSSALVRWAGEMNIHNMSTALHELVRVAEDDLARKAAEDDT